VLPHHESHRFALSAEDQQRLGISDRDIVTLVSAYRRFAIWRFDLATGHVFASAAAFDILGLDYTTGPMNMVAVTARIHPEDLPVLMETYERASKDCVGYHNLYRVRDGESYKFVRSVAGFRRLPDCPAGEIVGVIYELNDLHQFVAFADD